jgi:GTP-binding protein
MNNNLRNIAIIAHVDHGKTTMIDSMFKQSGTFRDNQVVDVCVMDSGEIEKERGITIMAKCTSLTWKDKTVNVVDTPGHADFGAEVERILGMVDGVLLLVDSFEGVMPQTKFVLGKALSHGLRPIVVINKIDKPEARPSAVIDEVFDLFVALNASDEQLDFPVLYSSGRDGWATLDHGVKKDNLADLFDKIVEYVKPPKQQFDDGQFRFLATMLEYDSFLGRTLTGKIYSGDIKVGSQVQSLNLDGKVVDKFKVTRIQKFEGIRKLNVDTASAGDIITISGSDITTVSNTICSLEVSTPLESKPIDPSTMSIGIGPNTSPLAGREGTKLTSNMIKERLKKEAENNIAITVTESEQKDSFEVCGRGELQLGILVENLRREGFELSISRPKVVFRTDENGTKLEPIEEVLVDVDDPYAGAVISKLQNRKAEMLDMKQYGVGRTRIIFLVPTRCLIGYQSEFMTDTRGSGVLNRIFHSYQAYKGNVEAHRNGVLISNEGGQATSYSLYNLEDRGIMFIGPQTEVYEGMIVGEHNRDNDLVVNVVKGKALTNVRASGSDESTKTSPPKELTLEDMISYIQEDELVEVTPKNLRLRKRHLNPTDRKRYDK